jgi:hypothetical protein
MAFTTWAAMREDIKAKLADHIANGVPLIGEYYIGDKRTRYRTYDELVSLLIKTYELEALESAGSTASSVSYGRHRRFR